jgi:putative ABC transport system substrate-binding protein
MIGRRMHRVVPAERKREPGRPIRRVLSIGRRVWVPAFAGTTGESSARADHMNRRRLITLLAGAAAAWPLAAAAQQRAVPVIGYLGARSAAIDTSYVAAFRQGLAENGFIPGQNVALELRFADYQSDRLPTLAAELVRRRVSVLVSAGGAAAPAAKAATATIPIVFSTGSDPVKVGLVQSLAHPGGNLTGATTLARELGAKRLGLLRDLVPGDAPLAHLSDASELDSENQVTDVQAAADQIGRRLIVFRVRTEGDIETAFATMAERAIGGVLIDGTSGLGGHTRLVVLLATRLGLPAVYSDRTWAVAGGLMTYSSSFTDSYHNVGVYAARILKGAKPADLPVLQPTKFELVINVSAAKALKLTIPSGIMAIADEVIE